MSKKINSALKLPTFNIGLLYFALGAVSLGTPLQAFAQQQPIEIKLGHVR